MTNARPIEKTPCPICSENAAPAYRPFCSKRCADVDLGRWITGRYAIPADDEDAPDDDDYLHPSRH